MGASAGAGRCRLSGAVGVFGRGLSAVALASFGARINLRDAASASNADKGAEVVSANATKLLDNKIKLHISRSRAEA